MKNVGQWLADSGKNPSKWWMPEHMNREFLSQYADPNEFYVGLVHGEPAVAAILQFDERNQSWQAIDGQNRQDALYMHWLCVNRKFAKKGFPKLITYFASALALSRGVGLLRADTNYGEMKLRKVYEDLGFNLIGSQEEDYRTTAFYQKKIN